MRMSATQARGRFLTARVARLATVAGSGRPHLVPITFAVNGEVIVTAVDGKPKSGKRLRRLSDIAENPNVTVLVDHYREDWSALWWARAEGEATELSADDSRCPELLEMLAEKYPQYLRQRPDGSLIVIAVSRWIGWSARHAARM